MNHVAEAFSTVEETDFNEMLFETKKILDLAEEMSKDHKGCLILAALIDKEYFTQSNSSLQGEEEVIRTRCGLMNLNFSVSIALNNIEWLTYKGKISELYSFLNIIEKKEFQEKVTYLKVMTCLLTPGKPIDDDVENYLKQFDGFKFSETPAGTMMHIDLREFFESEGDDTPDFDTNSVDDPQLKSILKGLNKGHKPDANA